MTSLALRPYQDATIAAVLGALEKGLTRVYYVAATGTGKTFTFVSLIRRLAQPGRPAVILAHRDELLKQARESVLRADPTLRVGIERAGAVAPRTCDVIVASVQTVGRKGGTRLDWIGEGKGASCIICDESHHAAADGYARSFDILTSNNPYTPIIGCTATPSRLDGLALHGRKGAPFQECVFTYGIEQAIKDGWLCQIRGHRVATGIDLSKVKMVAGDYATNSLADAVNVEARTVKAIEHWQEIAGGRQTIVFCVNVAHAESASEAWRQAGYSTAIVSGNTDPQKRTDIIEQYKSGKIQVLTNCEIFTEGFDAPETACIVMLRPTKSWGLYTQCCGRSTRLKQGQFKDAVIIDVVDNSLTHKLNEAPESTRGKRSTNRDKEDASVSALLGLPAGIDLEGHTVSEAADLKHELDGRAAIMERYRPETFADLKTMLHDVDMFSGITQRESNGSQYQWVQAANDWVLNVGSGQWIKLRANASGVWWSRVRIVKEGQEPILYVQCLETNELLEAMRRMEQHAEAVFENLAVARSGAKWRTDAPSDKQKALLLRRGISPAIVGVMSKGEAANMITRIMSR